jgi:hypothetical protein
MSRGSIQFFFPLVLRLEVEMFVNKNGKSVTELHDEKWLWDLTLLCDITHHTGYSNTKRST